MKLTIAQAQKIAFVLVDDTGVEVTGLVATFTVTVSKNGGAFAPSAGAKAEIGSGWYSYTLTAGETDTPGPLALVVTGAGAVQNNLLYQVGGVVVTSSTGPNILTPTEAATVLRCDDDDPLLLLLQPQVDAYIEHATGRDWTADTVVDPLAKAAARILLVQAHEDPGAFAQASVSLSWGLDACLLQLQVKALELELAGVPAERLALVVSQPASGDLNVAIGANLVLIFNHEMDSDALTAVSLETATGANVPITNTLDVTAKILTLSPTSDLTPSARYTVVIDHAPDIYGQTLEQLISFETAD